MTSSVRAAAEGAAKVEDVVREARGNAEQSGLVVKEAIGAMSEIKKSSDGINQIIGVIDDIAFQTNLLALNAGVER
ncbi:methyl-accepting chemotaxis protein, partial [Rhodovulum sulfidophilum]|uniref:methyl-accepting chemotaxis protein n=1 Tax=Rhodovulum sulfidophilum TaxID=35806 RepID=UPI001F30F94E